MLGCECVSETKRHKFFASCHNVVCHTLRERTIDISRTLAGKGRTIAFEKGGGCFLLVWRKEIMEWYTFCTPNKSD